MRAKLKNLLTGQIIDVHSTTDSPDSSYGLECWVDKAGNSYGQCQFGTPFGFELLPVGQGGPARGQGRKTVNPAMKKEQSKARISAWVLAWLDEHKEEGSRGELLESALIKVHKLKPPTAG